MMAYQSCRNFKTDRVGRVKDYKYISSHCQNAIFCFLASLQVRDNDARVAGSGGQDAWSGILLSHL